RNHASLLVAMQSFGGDSRTTLMMKLISSVPSSLLLEVVIRIAMAVVFALLQHVAPRDRDIHPEELWLYRNKPTAPYFPSWLVVVMVTVVVPTLMMLLLQQRQQLQKQPQLLDSEGSSSSGCSSRRATACQMMLLGYSLSLLLTGLITDAVKLIVGRPRPDFFYRCFPSGEARLVPAAAESGAVPDDGEPAPQQLQQLLLLVPSACTGDPDTVAEGRKSFPSGHASMSFASLAYVSFLLADWLQLFKSSARLAPSVRLLACLAPCLAASGIALSRLVDFHHHPEDVLAGSTLGLLVAFACHRCYRRREPVTDPAAGVETGEASGDGLGRRIDV
ncbi:hypothetical protein BOX15_Mlig021581g2, partial [Macrostomum lignano]